MGFATLTHLNFQGNATEALTFYHDVFGGHIMFATYAQTGVPKIDRNGGPATFEPLEATSPDADHLSFGMVMAESGFRIAGYDVYGATGGGIAAPQGAATARVESLTHTESAFVMLSGDSLEEINSAAQRLADGGMTIATLTADQIASSPAAYGMLTDRFGVTWILSVNPAH